MKKHSEPRTPCFTCGEDMSGLSADKVHDHITLHKRDVIIAEHPALLEIDAAIAEKYGAEIKIMF